MPSKMSSSSSPPLVQCLNNNPSSSSYLKSYPYLFVRETNQTDYFCTICDSYLKEEDLQSHLFEVHQANNVEDFFVRVADTSRSLFLLRSNLYICVVCWAKIPHLQDTREHRRGCKVNPTEDDLENGSVPMIKAEVMNGFSNGIADHMLTDDHHHPKPAGRKRHQQCSLCSMTVPLSVGFQAHLQDYHRVNCPLDQFTCPLCEKSPVIITELPSHLSTAHGVASGVAANSILLWVLASSSSSITSKSKKCKKSSDQQQQLPPSCDQHHQSKLNHLLISPSKTFKEEELQLTNGHHHAHIPTVLQSLLSKGMQLQQQPNQSNLAAVETIVSKFTRCHFVANGKESIQCLICSKWFAVPPVKHLRGHMVTFKEEKQRIVSLIGGCHVCIICYDIFDSVGSANNHLVLKHGIMVNQPSPPPPPPLVFDDTKYDSTGNELPTIIDLPPNNSGRNKDKVELDNAGRVKSGKVRKQCELCGEWSNIKWFFKHMSEVHQALFCRCCREYLPIHEHEEHKHWHSEPPYMGQKIRIEAHQPVIIDRKERASLTPIGSLASWGGSSGGKVVKAVDSGPPTPSKAKKRKAAISSAVGGESSLTVSPTKSLMPSPPISISGGQQCLIGHMEPDDKSASTKDTLMPKEICPVCKVAITYKNLARHIKLRHKIKYKFCHKCRKLVPNTTYENHKSSCNEIVIEGDRNEMMTPDEEYVKEDSLDPTDFLETVSVSSPMAEEDDEDEDINEELMEDSSGELIMDTRKSEEFRANTSKNKLESLMGKEFKHPRRRCAICGYSVSYSNFKRHLRNAHPAQYQECERVPGDFKKALASLSHEIGEGEEDDDSGTLLGHVMDDDEEDNTDEDMDEKGALAECERCGDRIRVEFLDRHMKMNHGGESDEEDCDTFKCPLCPDGFLGVDEVLEHCRDSHGGGYRWCISCKKCVLIRDFELHQTVEHGVEMAGTSPTSKVFNGPDCSHLFLTESSYKNHLQEAKCQKQQPKTNEDEDKALETLPTTEISSKEPISDEILKD